MLESSKTTDRPVLFSVELEQGILGGLMIHSQAMQVQACQDLRADHFYDPVHQRIFEAVKALVEAGKPTTPMMVIQSLPAGLKITNNMTGSQYLAALCARASSTATIGDYAIEVTKLFQTRNIIAAGDEMLDDLKSGVPTQDAMERYYNDIDAVRLDLKGHRENIETVGVSAELFVNRAMALRSNTMEPGIDTGLIDLDKKIGGLQGGELIIAAGRPGMGKTTFAASMARLIAKAGHGVAFFSLEMPRNQTMARLIADECYDDPDLHGPNGVYKTRIEYQRAVYPKGLSDTEVERVLDAERRLRDVPMLMDYSSRLTVGEIAVRARGMSTILRNTFGARLRVVVVDYIKHVQASDRYKGNRVYEIGEISAALKQLAKNTDTCVILLAQLSRAVENREDKRPQLQDLRESGDLEADADTVIFLYREAYYLKQDPEYGKNDAMQARFNACADEMDLIVAKQRMGGTGVVKVRCDMGCSAIRSKPDQTVQTDMLQRLEPT